VSNISNAETTTVEIVTLPRLRSGLGAFLCALPAAAMPATDGTAAALRPCSGAAATASLDLGRRPAVAAYGHSQGYQASGKQFAYTTLTIASGAGDLGPHPAREPV